MRYGIYFTFDGKTETALHGLRQKLAMEIAGVPAVDGKMGPHLMLLVFDDDNYACVTERFRCFADGTGGFSLKLNAVNAFEGRRNVLYVEPLMSEELQTYYLRCLNAFSDSTILPAYRDLEHWKPHITLAKRIHGDIFREAKVLAEKSWVPVEGRVYALGLIDVQKPLDILASKNLESGIYFTAPEYIPLAVPKPKRERKEAAAGRWNTVVTIVTEGYRNAVRILKGFGHVERTDFFNVLTLEVPDTAVFLDQFSELVAREPGTLNFISHITPAEETFCFHLAEEFETRARNIVLKWAPRLAGKGFHVRMHRRGHKKELSSHEEERLLAESLIDHLEKAGTPGRIRFDDPDAIIIIEMIGNEAGLSLWTREQIERYSFLGVR